jgi:predicted alpha-1,2-mannosidase
MTRRITKRHTRNARNRTHGPSKAVAGLALALFAIAAAPAHAARDYVKLVNPWVEADIARYFFFQSASNPFSFVKLRPDTSTNAAWGTGYRRNEDQVKGFSHVHEWSLSGVQVMPTTGGESVPKTQGDTGWQSHVNHDNETAEPGYHRLHLDRYGIDAQLTATDRVGMHRYTYEQGGQSDIIVNLAGQLGEAHMDDAHVERIGNRRLSGWVNERNKHTKLFFEIAFDKPFDSMRGWAGGKHVKNGEPIDELAADQMGVYVRYDHLRRGETVQMKVALSLTSEDGAARNMEAELPGWNFDTVKRASQKRWNDMLGRIDVSGGTHQQQVKFYTDLFHILCGRGLASDADGKYMDDTWNGGRVRQIPLDGHGKPKFAMYHYDALWLTQWNVNTMLGLAYPEIYSSFVQSQLQTYKDGGLLPRGPAAGEDTMVMDGSPVSSFITGAINKGIRDFDVDLAYDAMLDAQSAGGLFDKGSFEATGWSGGGGFRDYADRGFVPQELGGGPLNGGAGETLEYAYQDWGLAQLARRLGKRGINVAQFAKVTASSGTGARAVDGRPARSGDVRWVPTDANPWVQLDWETPQMVQKVVVTDPGKLRFSDGTSVDVSGPQTVTIGRKLSWVRFEGSGLDELEVWDDRDVADYLMERSRNWRNLFDPSTGFIRPKNRDGSWLEPFDPLSPEDFVEANSWQASWFTAHDVMGMANLLGGEQAYADKLNYAFTRAEESNFIGSYGQGYVSYGNQPGLEVAHLFNYVGFPWLTQHWVRQVKEKTFGSIATDDGYGHHDEDQGQMGSISALMAMGLFEVTGGGLDNPVYDITSPIFREVRIALDRDYYKGREFRIRTHGDLADQYIQRARLDGKVLDNAWFRHDQLADGGALDLWLGPEPNKDWGVAQLPPSESESEHRSPVYASALAIDGPDRIEEPYGTARYTASFTPENTSLKYAYWSVTEADGSPTDKATIDQEGVLKVSHLDGTVKVTARAADAHGATQSVLVTLDLDPAKLRGNAARWPGVKATASSEFDSNYTAAKVADGIIGDKDGGDWASRGEREPWVQLDFPKPVKTDRIVIYDRPGTLDDVNGGELQFSDGSTVPVTGVPVDGTAKTVEFPLREVEWVRFQVRGGTGQNPGLSELEVYALPGAPEPPASVTVTRSGGQAKVAWTAPPSDGGAPVIDYVVRTYRAGQVVAEKTVDGLEASLPATEGDTFAVAARNLTGTGAERAELTALAIEGPDRIVEPDSSTTFTVTPATAGVRWSVTGPATIDAGGVLKVQRRSGIAVITAASAGVSATKRVDVAIDPALIRDNVSPRATATASSTYDLDYAPARAADGEATTEWASAGEQDPWIALAWATPVRADRIVLRDRAGGDDAHGGVLRFSDGSTIEVEGIPGDGAAKTVTFGLKDVTSVRFEVHGGTGGNVGLAELEVLAVP